MAPSPSFHYHANAHALSGRLHRPLQHLVEVQAGSTLSIAGGHSHSRVDNFRFKEMISMTAGYSHVSGSEKHVNGKSVPTTLATATVEGLNILDMVTADRIVARLASSYDESSGESRILLVGSRFENLRIAGYEVKVTLHHELAVQLGTLADARKQLENNEEFRTMAADPFASGDSPENSDAHGTIRCSLVKEVHPPKCPGVESRGVHGHVFVIPEFGKIRLAEVVFEHGRKTLTMLRVELGSPTDGTFVGAQADSNGRLPGGGG
jgi:hypothetical protein